MNRQYLPNIITCLRVVLIIPVLWGLLTANYRLAFYLFVLAGFSDGLDGLLARHFGCISRFGAILDPLADKLLLMSSFFVLTWLGIIPFWLVVIIVARDFWIMSGVVAYHYLVGEPDFAPSFISKLNTALQIILVMLLLFQQGFWHFPNTLIEIVMMMVLVTTLLSFIDYTWVWGRRALHNRK